MASAMASLANDGVRMKPHLVSEIIDATTRQGRVVEPQPAERWRAKPENVAVIRKAMVGVNVEGTSASSFRGAPYTSGGKTGTAQVIAIAAGAKYNAAAIDERHRDHALFIAYAPAEDPKIAVAMIVENAGFGAANAAPIARRAFDYWLLGLYPSEEDMAAVKLGKATTPIGKQRPVADVPWPIGGAVAPAAPAASSASAAQAAVPASATVKTGAR